MGNLIYIIVIIAYFIWQAHQASKKRKEQEEAQQNPEGQPGRKVREVAPPTLEEKMKDVFREVEMKSKPYARPDKAAPQKKAAAPAVQTFKQPAPKPEKKKPSPFLDFDMTQEEVVPEGTWTTMGEERFSKTGYDYNKAVVEPTLKKINLRDAVIGKIILERPEW
ncbi:MAG: hypothetical protein ABIO46_13115 [Chitinophagales bacterium]